MSSESAIRDALAVNLGKLFPELSLVETEYYLPAVEGTRGFIDILARKNGGYVVIEVKKSNQTAREALHEVLKYHEALKAKLGLKDSEIECLVVSTEWRELLLSFSSFVAKAKFVLRGFKIEFEAGQITSCAKVEPLRLESDRLFSPVQSIYLYRTRAARWGAFQSHRSAFDKKGIEDYVLVMLGASAEHLEYLRYFQESLGINSGPFPYMIYSVLKRLPEERYREIMCSDPANKEEADFVEAEEKLVGSRLLEHLENNVLGNVEPFPKADDLEIGYPAKFKHKILEDEGWIVERVVRFGSLRENENLGDEQILDEISGLDASTIGRLEKSAALLNQPQYDELLSSLSRCFENDNPVWLNEIKLVLERIRQNALKNGNGTVDVSVLSPSNILLSMYRSLTSKEGYFLPTYSCSHVLDEERVELFFGALEYTAKPVVFSELLKNRFDGDPFKLVFPMCWGGYLSIDREILADLGLKYSTFRTVIVSGESGPIEKLVDFEFVPIAESVPDGFGEFVKRNEAFVEELIRTVDEQMIAPAELLHS